jgi:signal peptidase II
MTRTRLIGLAAAGIVFFSDQLLKWIVVEHLQLPYRGAIDVLPIFRLTWVGNHGVSMGFLTATTPLGRWLLVVLTAAIAIGVLAWLWREKVRGDALALGLVLGGALGNISDRLRFGFVVDFLDLHFGDIHPFLVFNVADAAITIGVLLLLLRALLTRQKPGPAEDLHA